MADISVIEKEIESNIGRVVAFVITPIITTVTGVVTLWLTRNLGVHIDPAAAAAFVVTTVGGVALGAFKWLENRGNWEVEVGKVLAWIKKNEQGNQTPPPPVA